MAAFRAPIGPHSAPIGAYELIALHALQVATLTRRCAAAWRGVQGYAQRKAWRLNAGPQGQDG